MNDKEKNKKGNRKFNLNQLYFYLTEGCNLACRHCWLTPKQQTDNRSYPSLPVELFEKIIAEAGPLGLATVKLTGGEPLLHPQIHEILERIKARDIALSMETNGVLCTPGLAKEIMACKTPFIAVSLDGADAETHEHVRGVPGSFDGAIAGIKNLVKAGAKPQIMMTIMRDNVGQMEDVVSLAESLGAGSVKFNLVQPTGRGEKMTAAGETLRIEELIRLGSWVENTLSSSTALTLYYHQPPAFRPLSKLFGKDGTGCMNCTILGILGVLPDGSYALCGIGTHVPDLIFGQAAAHRLEDVWENAPVLRELRESIPHRFEGICSACFMKNFCLASCIAQNYYRSKSLWAPFWFCAEAHENGLFPATRISDRPLSRANEN
jgi:SynChlorMet cassette radical SAM/SPASM protein ScmF